MKLDMGSGVPYRLGSDIDETLAGYLPALKPYVARFGNRRIEDLKPPRQWSLVDAGWCRHPEEYLEFHARAVEEGLYRNLPVFPNAKEALQRLSDKGVRVLLLTNRYLPYTDPAQVREDTEYWIRENGIPCDELHIVSSKPSVEADLYIDDAPHNIKEILAAGKKAVVYRQPYNQSVGTAPYVSDWREGETFITRDRLLHAARALKTRPAQTPQRITPPASSASRTAFTSLARFSKPCGKRTLTGEACRRVGRCPVHA